MKKKTTLSLRRERRVERGLLNGLFLEKRGESERDTPVDERKRNFRRVLIAEERKRPSALQTEKRRLR